MKSRIKQFLLVGVSFSLAALTARRFSQQNQIEGDVSTPDGAASPDTDPNLPGKVKLGKLTPGSRAGTNLESKNLESKSLDLKSRAGSISATTLTFNGTVVRRNGRLAIRETAGIVYLLDSPGSARKFDGEEVRVTGRLDVATHLLHIESIESASAWENALLTTAAFAPWSHSGAESGTDHREVRSSPSPSAPSSQSENPRAAA